MPTWKTSLIGLLAGLSCISAAPIETLTDEGTLMVAHDTGKEGPEFSLQLLYNILLEDKYKYIPFRGKQGMSVDPCKGLVKSNPFEQLHITQVGKDSRANAIDHPPFPSAEVSVSIDVPGKKDCRYVGNGVDAGQIRCGDQTVSKCGKDPQYDEPTFKCTWGRIYHRGYSCEF
ncbi:hypothetical protein BKA58DRAFT_433503 [Alternaria rosae]|uniref:uncharacterized protein n=1 Tax=Alternaria rosae TaxID=1187941 RepID=UPI001E8D9D55|nr:uncharacterized protein BKA58DRAFT_433503 [Alternaria rosae]KAH6881727.1 hypothetical protein BKA58DRAFT_433503 [Alternaria rosae]